MQTLFNQPQFFEQQTGFRHPGGQGSMGADLDAAIAADTFAVIKSHALLKFKNSFRRAVGPALAAGTASVVVDNRFLENMRADQAF